MEHSELNSPAKKQHRIVLVQRGATAATLLLASKLSLPGTARCWARNPLEE